MPVQANRNRIISNAELKEKKAYREKYFYSNFKQTSLYIREKEIFRIQCEFSGDL